MKTTVKKWAVACTAFLLMATNAMAQNENLVLHYTFDNVSGTSVSDASASGVTAKLVNQAKVEKMGKYYVLNLGTANGYLDMTSAAGAVAKELSDFTVSAYYLVDKDASLSGNGYFFWSFSASSANSQTSGPYTAYRLNAQRFATSPNGWGSEVGIEKGSEATRSTWQNVTYVQNGTTGKLYIDGTLIGTKTGMPVLSKIFTSAPAYNWIGRPPFSGDSYLKNTMVADFRLYNKAIDAALLDSLAGESESYNYEYRYGTSGDMTKLKAKKDECEAFMAQITASEYLQGAIDELQDQINIASAYIASGSASQVVIDECIESMTSALANLKAVKGKALWAESKFKAGDRGFVHPGGLHTQEDFERVKKLLADGDPTITKAWNILKSNEYSGSGIATWPVETIVRGGGVGENYMNACRGAAMAYQNALRWKIEGTEANAKAAVRILMAWADACKVVGGDSNYALASGLYGYQFAQAAELVRDYEGWAPEDFARFKAWMLEVWYPKCIGFLRGRNGTWENAANKPNAGHGDAGNRPGHYWSNWGLCNTLALMSIGILCDDVHIYNQGLSYYKYDQVGSFTETRGDIIYNDGLTEFIGNLVPVVHDDERGPYGKLGQMQESGRDQGHSLMALGLAADICQVAWNQGDDLYSYMDNRFAAGAEYIAAYNHSGVEDLPWTEYRYADCRTAWHNTWNMTGNNGGGRGAPRPYWDRIIGHFEGVKGIKMTYSKKAAIDVRGTAGADGGGHNYGETSGGYDHLGFSTLMCYNPNPISADMAPIVLIPCIEYDGQVYHQAELGGLVNTFKLTPVTDIPAGSIVKLMPHLPEGESGNGTWLWDTGETTKDIEVTVNSSRMYRVTYTDERGVKSRQVYSISVSGDCSPYELYSNSTVGGAVTEDTVISAIYGKPVTLNAWSSAGWDYFLWSNGKETSEITIPNVTFDRVVTLSYMNQGGNVILRNFHIKVNDFGQTIIVDGETYENYSEMVVDKGQNVELIVTPSESFAGGAFLWSTGETTSKITIADIQESGKYTVEISDGENTTVATFMIYVKETADRKIEAGNYLIRHRYTNTFLTNLGDGTANLKAGKVASDGSYDNSQAWYIASNSLKRSNIVSLVDSTYLNGEGAFVATTYYPFRFQGAAGTMYFAVMNKSTSEYWNVAADGTLAYGGVKDFGGYDFELIPLVGFVPSGIDGVRGEDQRIVRIEYYSLDGRRIAVPTEGVVIRRLYFGNGKVNTDKLFVK